MSVENKFEFIDDFDLSWPDNNPDMLAQQAEQTRGVKSAVTGSFPNLGQLAVTKTAAELNASISADSADTLTNKIIDNAIYTGVQTGFNGNIIGNADTATTATTASVITNQGQLATLDEVDAAHMAPFAVQAEIAVSTPGGIGTYAMIYFNGTKGPGENVGSTGSNLFYANASGNFRTAVPAGGTWKAMGNVGGSNSGDKTTLWLRIV